MATYIVERCLPGLRAEHRGALQAALDEASRRLTASGRSVRYLGSVFVPGRARCYCCFESATAEIVRMANEAALVPFTSVDEAVCLLSTEPITEGAPSARGDGVRRTTGASL